MSKRTTSSPMPETITVDLPCVSCGYNLKTIAVESRCPECGDAVMETLGAWRSAAVHPDSVRSMRQQATVLGWTPVAGFLATVVAMCLGGVGLAVFAVFTCTLVHVVGSATFVAAAEDALGASRTIRIGATVAALFGLGVVAAFAVQSPFLVMLMFPVMITSASQRCTRYATRVAGAAGPNELEHFGGSVYGLTQVASASASVLFMALLLSAAKIVAVDDIWLVGYMLLCVGIVTLLVVWLVFHTVLMFRMKRWLAHALVGLAFLDSAGGVEPESEQGGGGQSPNSP